MRLIRVKDMVTFVGISHPNGRMNVKNLTVGVVADLAILERMDVQAFQDELRGL